VWTEIVRNAMRIDHGWGPSAERYHELYHRVCATRRAPA
jgi:glycogen synthase